MATPLNVPFVGYPGQAWAVCQQTLAWFVDLLDGGATPAQQGADAAEVTFATLLNGAGAVAAWQAGGALTIEAANLAAIQALPLSLLAQQVAFLNARATSVALAAEQISALPPNVGHAITGAVPILLAGMPAVPDPMFLEWCMGFAGETAPVRGHETVVNSAADCANAWAAIAAAIAVLQGDALDYRYDAAVRMWRTANAVAVETAALTSGPFVLTTVPFSTLWNQCVALPSILLDASLLTTPPNTLVNQQGAVVRNALLNAATQAALFLLALRRPQVSAPATAQLRNTDTLMDLAARATGAFENWTTIAALNGLRPPFPGPTAPGGGTSLLLPTAGTAPPAASGPVPSYAANVLGTDYDFGPVNAVVNGQVAQGTMPAWGGDFALVTGYANYGRALGRRLLTPLSALIYEPTYGSRIPAEVGAIQDQTEAQRLAAYADATWQADPRTGSVIANSATILPLPSGGPPLATVNATVQPIGPGSTPVNVNLTISPLA